MNKEIVIKGQNEPIRELERVHYERSILKRLIAFYINLCDTQGKQEMLNSYISDYKRELELDELHYQMLQEKIVDENFPEEFQDIRERVNFFINFDSCEIKYYV